MRPIKWKKLGLGCGIGFGIVLVTAFISSQLIYPILFPRPRIEVPNIVGMSFSKASNELRELGLHIVISDSVYSETQKIDTIIEQNPEPGTKMKTENTIHVLLSKGSRIVAVPDIVDMDYLKALEELKDLGLIGQAGDYVFSDKTNNTVISTVPRAGAKVSKGSKIKIKVSKGPEPISTVEDDELLYPEPEP